MHLNPKTQPVFIRALNTFKVRGPGPGLVSARGRNYVTIATALPFVHRRWVLLLNAPENDFSDFAITARRQNMWFSALVVGLASLLALGLIDPAESRLIMSMKTYLAQGSFRETRVFSTTMTLQNLIARFLRSLMDKAGISPAQVSATIGRPVRFAGELADDELGVKRLKESFVEAGFAEPNVVLEPEGAGWRFMQRLDAPATVLVGDFGGGTSDFSVMRFDRSRASVRADRNALRRGPFSLPMGFSSNKSAGSPRKARTQSARHRSNGESFPGEMTGKPGRPNCMPSCTARCIRRSSGTRV